jgi:hypothetical protein
VIRNLEGVALLILQAAKQAAPPSLALPQGGRERSERCRPLS